MSSFWADACKYAIDKPLQTRLDILYASSVVTVACPLPLLLLLI